MRKVILIGIVGLMVGRFADVYTTHVALERGFREGNPIVAWLIGQWGTIGYVVYSLLVVGLTVLVIEVIRSELDIDWRPVKFYAAAYGFVSLWWLGWAIVNAMVLIWY